MQKTLFYQHRYQLPEQFISISAMLSNPQTDFFHLCNCQPSKSFYPYLQCYQQANKYSSCAQSYQHFKPTFAVLPTSRLTYSFCIVTGTPNSFFSCRYCYYYYLRQLFTYIQCYQYPISFLSNSDDTNNSNNPYRVFLLLSSQSHSWTVLGKFSILLFLFLSHFFSHLPCT